MSGVALSRGWWSVLAVAVMSVGAGEVCAENIEGLDMAFVGRTRLDMSFIHGGAGGSSDVWAALNGSYVPGRYLVDLSLNGRGAGKQILDVTPQDSEALCLTEAWLAKAEIYISTEYFRDGYDAAHQCWVLTKAPSVVVDFDVSTQSLALGIPQKGLLKQPERVEWDYGTHAFRMNYNVNANAGQNNTSAFGSADLKVNVGRWVVSSNATASAGDSGDNSATLDMFTANRVIRSLSADLAVGKTSTGDGLLGSVGTYGVSLSRNNSMKPGSLGYAPVFSGVANGPSRVTLTQGGRMLHSEMVPTGPFSITDVSLYNSGDVTMNIAGDDGRESTQIFPLSVVAGQLSPGTHEFNVAVGVPDEGGYLEGGVLAASYGYGLDGLTLRAGSVVNPDWQGVSASGVVGLGSLGSVSVDEAFAVAKYLDGARNGNKTKLSWDKLLETTKTSLRLSWSRQGEEYEDITSFDPTVQWAKERRGRLLKDEWSVGVSQSVGELFNLSLSGWQRSYHPNIAGSGYYIEGKDNGITGALSKQVGDISLNFGLSGSKTAQGGGNWSASTSVSVPFSLFGRKYSSSTSVSTSQSGGVGFSTGVSGSMDDRLSYGLGGGRDSEGGLNSYLNASYAGERAHLGGSLNSSSSGVSGSLSASGAVLVVPEAEGVVFSPVTGDTVAVVSVKDTPGVKVTSGDRFGTDVDGNLVVSLSDYDWNAVTIDAASLPLNTELGSTSLKVVPTRSAVVWMPFEVLKVHRYLLQVRQRDGAFVPGGVWARDSKNTLLGFVANNGVLMINAVDAPGDVTLGDCRIPAARLQETEKLQEITCE